MIFRSVRARIFGAMTCVTFGVVLAGMWTMNRLVDDFLEREIGTGLNRARNSYETFSKTRDRLLADKLRSLSQIPHLRATLATPDVDADTIAWTAKTVAEVAGTPLILVSNRSGSLSVDANQPDLVGDFISQQPGAALVLEGGEFHGTWEHQGVLYRVMAGPVALGGEVLGALALGFPLDAVEARELSRVTGHDVYLIANQQLIGSSNAGASATPRDAAWTTALIRAARDGTRFHLDGVEHMVTRIPMSDDTELIFARPIQEIVARFHTASRTLALTGLGLALAGILIARRISRAIAKPIHDVVVASEQLAEGDLNASVTTLGTGDLETLGRSFNEMARRIRTLIDEVLEKAEAAERASSAKSDFLATMSHELRTPLNGVLGFTEILERTASTEEERDYASRAHRAGSELLELVKNVLDLTAMDTDRADPSSAPFQLDLLVTQVVQEYREALEEKGISVTVAADIGQNAQLIGEKGRIRQALRCLVDNAEKFTSEGHVRVAARVTADDEGDQATLRVEVHDTGIGVEPDALERVFEPFEQGETGASRAYGGSGLGLALVRRTAKWLEGDSGVESRVGEGSMFWFTARVQVNTSAPDSAPDPAEVMAEVPPALPSASPSGRPSTKADQASPSKSPELKAARRTQRILYAEDNPMNRRVVQLFLRKGGWPLDCAENGEEAVRMMESGEYDLILMDCQMPVLDGLGATRAIRELEEKESLPRVPILALTANAMEGDRERCLESGMDDFLAKPATYKVLEKALTQWLNQEPESCLADDVGRA
ncbi:MAG: response regulator [Planctomycetota bacterium]